MPLPDAFSLSLFAAFGFRLLLERLAIKYRSDSK